MPAQRATDSNIDLSDTPKFGQPPVVETVLGVQFKPLHEMHITHFGSFQERIKPNGFIHIQEYPRLEHQIEHKEAVSRMFQFLPTPSAQLPRVWFLSDETEEGQSLIQLQNDRLVQNWRRMSHNSAIYPSYSRNREDFGKTLDLLIKFAGEYQLGKIVPDQCEIVYVNQISIKEYPSPAEAFRRIFDISIPHNRLAHMANDTESVAFSCAYWNDSINGRLQIEAGTVSLVGTGSDRLDFRITAKGTPRDTSVEGIMGWLDTGHYYLVNTFADVTTKEMHKVWERKK